ncbi:MAG: hypothetical protein ABGZ49_03070, partial [Akkermansiaceae bacterium]
KARTPKLHDQVFAVTIPGAPHEGKSPTQIMDQGIEAQGKLSEIIEGVPVGIRKSSGDRRIARWGGIVRERGMMVIAVFGNIVTSWSWFGTNMLGIGLHSYGFTNAAFTWLSAFVASQLIIMGLGFVRIPGQAITRSADSSNSGA